MATALTHDGATNETATKWSVAAVTAAGALLGGIAGIAIAIPLTATGGVELYIATAIDIGIGLALIGGLIGANIAGTD
jgi:hypothetical protein